MSAYWEIRRSGTKVLDKISKPEQDGGRTYKGSNFFSYDDTELGRRAALTGLKLREFFVLPQLASPATTHAARSKG